MKRSILILIAIFSLAALPAYAQQQDDETTDAPTFGVSAEVIAEHPEPAVTTLEADPDRLHDRTYRRVDGTVQRYDAPNGTPVSTIDAGFNFVTISQAVDGWAEVAPGRWVPQDDLLNNVPVSSYSGVLLPEDDLPYTMAWILVDSYGSKTPGGDEDESNPLLSRYDAVYIYDSFEMNGWRWYQVGIDQWIHQTLVAKVLPIETPEAVDTERWVSIDLYEQVAIAYEGDTAVFATLISSGLPEWFTREGLFHIYVRYERTIMSGAAGQPDFYYLEEVPWTMYFDNDIGLHGAYWHDGFGYRRSHGCVNMSITDAHWLYEFTAPEFDEDDPEDEGAAVYVYSSDDYR
jgi:hypothetical protein